jgi:hypothetical protein
MISFKGRLSFLQYLLKKPHKWGMKAWVLADSASGYVGWKLYTGKDGDQRDCGLADRVVLDFGGRCEVEGEGVCDGQISIPVHHSFRGGDLVLVELHVGTARVFHQQSVMQLCIMERSSAVRKTAY